MKTARMASALALVVLVIGCGDDTPSSPSGSTSAETSFFVSSRTSTTGNLGGLRAADAMCRELATAAGLKAGTWRAYLSVERDPDNGNGPTHARDRIGSGPWVNSAGASVARDLTELHARRGDVALFVDERGQRINGQWAGSPTPNEHDILTGTRADGTVMPGMTCNDWTSDSASIAAQVGHSDGLGPNMDASGTLSSWNSAHASQSCANTAPRGGAGRIYCFKAN